jgi:hypothetical protein
MGRFLVSKSTAGVDPSLLGWIQAAAANSPYDVQFESGKREGDPRFHGKGMATDIQLVDPKTGKIVPNYQTPENFAAYQGFANAVHQAAGDDPRLRWGGYFSGGKGKYGALDLMHFDLGGQQVGMAGGGWGTGLTPQQAAIWGLKPGEGGDGGGQPPPSPTGAMMASAVEPRSAITGVMAGNPFDAITDAAPKRGGLVGAGSAGGGLSATPDADAGIPPLETASATTPVQNFKAATQPNAPVTDQLGQLAGIFKVAPQIGQAPVIGAAAAQRKAVG